MTCSRQQSSWSVQSGLAGPMILEYSLTIQMHGTLVVGNGLIRSYFSLASHCWPLLHYTTCSVTVYVSVRPHLSNIFTNNILLYQLCAQFLQGSSAPQACWIVIGIGVRLAQDVGAHRRKLTSSKPTAEDELWKRAFW